MRRPWPRFLSAQAQAIAVTRDQPWVCFSEIQGRREWSRSDLVLFRFLPLGEDLNNRPLWWKVNARRWWLSMSVTSIVCEHGTRVQS